MARVRVQSRRGLISGPRRTSTWFFFTPLEQAVAAASTATLLYTMNAAALALRPFTIVRTLLWFNIISDQSAAVENQFGALGLAVVSDQAVAVGVTAVPNPISDQGSDLWFGYKGYGQSGSTDATAGNVGRSYVLESKAMRKVDIGEDLAVVHQLAALSDGIILHVSGRMLIKNN